MCQLDLVSGFLMGAKVAYLIALGLLAIGIANSASLFAAAANVPLMIGVIVNTAASTALYVAALTELDKCATGPCAGELQRLRGTLIALLATMATFSVAVAALPIIAAIPFAGAAAIGTTIAAFVGLTGVVAAAVEAEFSNATTSFNECRRRAMAATIRDIVLGLSFVAGVAGTIVNLLAIGISLGSLLRRPR